MEGNSQQCSVDKNYLQLDAWKEGRQQQYLCGNVPLGAPDLHRALLHIGDGALLPIGQVAVGPGQWGHLVE